jgi:quinol monooxygenase YgiN
MGATARALCAGRSLAEEPQGISVPQSYTNGPGCHVVAGTTREGVGVAIKAISKFTVQPGGRDEFVSLFESLVSQHISSLRAAGCLDSTLYTVVDEPDMAVEIADWESADARDVMMQSEAMAAFAPLFMLLSAPPSATVVNPLH